MLCNCYLSISDASSHFSSGMRKTPMRSNLFSSSRMLDDPKKVKRAESSKENVPKTYMCAKIYIH